VTPVVIEGHVISMLHETPERSAIGATARVNTRQGATVVVVSTGCPTGLRRTGSDTHPPCSARA